MKTQSARKNKHLFRNPEYMGGFCVVCRKRQRNFQHEDYPYMCDKCIESRGVSIYDKMVSRGKFNSNKSIVDRIESRDREIEQDNAPPTRASLEARGLPPNVIEIILARENPSELREETQEPVQILNTPALPERFLAARKQLKNPTQES